MELLWLWGGFLIASVFAALLYRAGTAIQDILQWPQAKGTVLTDSLVLRTAGWPQLRRKGFYITSVKFAYEVDGKNYIGRRIVPVGWTIREGEQERIKRNLESFSIVLYNPANPADAYLDIPDRFQHGSISWITVSFILAMFIAIIFGLKLLTNAS